MGTERTVQQGKSVIKKITASLMLFGVLIAGLVFALTGKKAEVTSVEVFDQTTGGEYGDHTLIDDELIKKELLGKKAYSDLDVVVYAKNGDSSDNLNEDTLNFARSKHPEWISGDKWADDVFIISLNVESDPTSRIGSGQVGTYFGENVKIEGEESQHKIQEKGYSYFRSNDWNGGILTIADIAIHRINSPILFKLAGLGFGGLSFAAGIGYYAYGRKTLSALKEADDELNALSYNVDNYVRNAGNVLVGNYASRISDSSNKVLHTYTDLLDERDGLIKNARNTVTSNSHKVYSLKDKTLDLKHEVELVTDAMLIYEKDEGWREAWKRQTEELRIAIRDVRENISHQGSTISRIETEFNEINNRYYQGTEDVDLLLDRIDYLHQEISDIVGTESERQLMRIDDNKKRKYVQEGLNKELHRRHRSRHSSLFSYYSPYPYYTYATYSTGYSNGVHSYQASQSSSSNSSYGGSGGGFSGSGSSSSF